MSEGDTPAEPRERDVAAIAALFAEPARAAMLDALAGGIALPAGELARCAGIQPATATSHLRRLVDGHLITVRTQGRHRYYELAGPQVATVLEELARIAPPRTVRSLREHSRALALAEARTCYDHLAGRRGVQLRERLLEAGALHELDPRDHELTRRGREALAKLAIDADGLTGSRRVFARSCLDSTERRPHLAGALPAALTARFLELGWLSRDRGRRLRIADEYDRQLEHWLSR
jgi:DNA-binding transcriptional ArsR family regulator